jgi:hypothetical protein
MAIPEASVNLRNLGRLGVDAKTGLRDTLDAHNGALAVGPYFSDRVRVFPTRASGRPSKLAM